MDFVREVGFFRAEDVFRAVVFLRVPDRDPDDFEDVVLPPEDLVLDPDLAAPFDPLSDWMRRFEASKTTDPAPPTALDRRYAIVPPAANFPRDFALPTPEATSCRTPSTRFCPADFGDTAFFSNFARLVGMSHAFSPPSALLSIAPRLLMTATGTPLCFVTVAAIQPVEQSFPTIHPINAKRPSDPPGTGCLPAATTENMNTRTAARGSMGEPP